MELNGEGKKTQKNSEVISISSTSDESDSSLIFPIKTKAIKVPSKNENNAVTLGLKRQTKTQKDSEVVSMSSPDESDSSLFFSFNTEAIKVPSKNENIALAKLKKKTLTSKPLASCYKEIEKKRRKSKNIVSPSSPKKKKHDDAFEKLKENIECHEDNITFVDTKSDIELAIFNWTSDSEDEDFKQKKIEIQKRTITTVIGSGKSVKSIRQGVSIDERIRETLSEVSNTSFHVEKGNDNVKDTKPIILVPELEDISDDNANIDIKGSKKNNTEASKVNIDKSSKKISKNLKDKPNKNKPKKLPSEKGTEKVEDSLITMVQELQKVCLENATVTQSKPDKSKSREIEIIDLTTISKVESERSISTDGIAGHGEENETPPSLKLPAERMMPTPTKSRRRVQFVDRDYDTSNVENCDKSEQSSPNFVVSRKRKSPITKAVDAKKKKRNDPEVGIVDITSVTSHKSRRISKVESERPISTDGITGHGEEYETPPSLKLQAERMMPTPTKSRRRVQFVDRDYDTSNVENCDKSEQSSPSFVVSRKRKRPITKAVEAKKKKRNDPEVGIVDITSVTSHKSRRISKVESERSISTDGITGHGEEYETPPSVKLQAERMMPTPTKSRRRVQFVDRDYDTSNVENCDKSEQSSPNFVVSRKRKSPITKAVDAKKKEKDDPEVGIVDITSVTSHKSRRISKVESERSISTDGITGHGEEYERPPSLKLLAETMMPREIVDMDHNSRFNYMEFIAMIENTIKDSGKSRIKPTPTKSRRRVQFVDRDYDTSNVKNCDKSEQSSPSFVVSRKRKSPITKAVDAKENKINDPEVGIVDVPSSSRQSSSVDRNCVQDWLNKTPTTAKVDNIEVAHMLQNLLERLDTTLAEIHQNTSKEFVGLFTVVNRQLEIMKEERHETYLNSTIAILTGVSKIVETQLAEMDYHAEERVKQLKRWQEITACKLLRRDCEMKQTMVELLREDVKAVLDRLARTPPE